MTVSLHGNQIHIQFGYNPELIDLVRALPDREWDSTARVWTIPATAWHARRMLALLENHLAVNEDVRRLASKDQGKFLTSRLDLSVGDLRPFPYQSGCVEFLNSIGGRGIIGDDVGAGKTIEAICYARYKDLVRFLVVAPASVTYKWKAEIVKWYPEVADRVCVIENGKTPIHAGGVHIISYDMMARRASELTACKYRLIIYDEFHKLKNHKTLRFKGAKLLSVGVPHILGLSGTPILNHPRELYNMLHMLNPRAWQWYPFFNRYCGGPEMGYDGALHLDELEDRLGSVMIRRFKRELRSQMPAFQRTVVPFKMEDRQMQDYLKLVAEDGPTIRRLFPQSKGYFVNKLDWLMAIRQYLERVRASHIKEWAEDFLESSTGKLVIYCGFLSTVEYLEKELRSWKVAKIVGSIPNAERDVTRQRWQTTMDQRVMLLTSAGGEGIDLFGLNGIESATVLFAGREWSPMMEEQVEGRLDRTGQTYPVEAVYLIADDTIDRDIDQLIQHKRSIIRDTVHTANVDTVVSDLLTILERRGITKKEHTHGKSID